MGRKQAAPSGFDTQSSHSVEYHGMSDVTARETQCGLGSCRPAWMQRFNNMAFFTTTLSFWSLFGSINFSYYTSVITQIEKAYGLSSSMTGFIKNIDNIGYVCFVIVFSHFCRYANKPRLFAMATVCSSVAIGVFALPHFIWGVGEADPAVLVNSTHPGGGNDTTTRSRVELCDGLHEEETQMFCSNLNKLRSFNAGALGFFILSEMLQGMAQSPKFTLSMTYMDDNAKDKSPFFIAFMFSMRAFAPVTGFMLGAWTTSLYVDLSDPRDLSQRDPRWVGAWWLGFLICAGCSLLWAFPMLLFPPKIPQKNENPEDARRRQEDEQQSVLDKAKDLPKALVRLVRNKLYVTVILAICLEIYQIGFITFQPKYMESYFGLTASKASIVTGLQAALAWALGPLVSGFIVSKMKRITPFTLMRAILILSCLSTICFSISLVFECPQERWGGQMSPEGPTPLECASACSCDSQSFNPVCGSDGVNYFTPCHAGCATQTSSNTTSGKVFTDCACVEEGAGTATPGVCKKQCNHLIPYAVVLFFSKFLASMDSIPTMMVFMRCVESKDKAIALAGASAILQVVGFPAPMVFGVIIDGACVVLQGGGSCASRKGACLLYDTEKFKYYMHGFVIIIKAVACLLYMLGLYFSRNMVLYGSDSSPEKEDVHVGEDEQEARKKPQDGPEHELKLLGDMKQEDHTTPADE